MIKKIFAFFLILTISHCGFTPIYNNTNTINYSINITKITGDRLINNLISNEIKRNSNSNFDKIFNIEIDTNYSKSIISKNAKGAISDYELNVKTNFVIKNNNNNIEVISLEEKQIIKNISDLFEQKNYENTIKKNFATSMVRKLNLKLLSKK